MERVASLIAASINMYSLYPANHPRVRDSVQQVRTGLREVLQRDGEESMAYLLVGDDLLAGGQLIRETTLPVREFIGVLRQRGVESLTLADGADDEEIAALVSALATGEGVASSAHVRVGTVHLVMDEKPQEDEPRRDLFARLEVMREAWARFRVERKLPIDQLEELVWSLIDSVGATARGMLPLAKLREHDEYTFVNAINVSLLVVAQARSLAIWGPMLHAFGMAGLLHDIGKLGVPESILNKAGKLDDDEWKIMMRHPSQGASYLIEREAPPLSVIVAYEHHLRHDGRPNYPLLRTHRVPHLASRMTAIADAYDGMCATRPYQTTVGGAAALEILKHRSSSFYDSMLVANFARIMGEHGEPAA
jgi:HD-GYP domain-containing protein (c-di-GMP phosphodiesterase class II)